MKTQLYLETKKFEKIDMSICLLLIHFVSDVYENVLSFFFSMKIPDLSQDEK